MVAPSTAGRTKRGLVAGGYMRVMRPKKQMVEVERIYKGEEMMMPMMKLTRTSETPVDTFSAATKIEAAIQIGRFTQVPLVYLIDSFPVDQERDWQMHWSLV